MKKKEKQKLVFMYFDFQTAESTTRQHSFTLLVTSQMIRNGGDAHATVTLCAVIM